MFSLSLRTTKHDGIKDVHDLKSLVAITEFLFKIDFHYKNYQRTSFNAYFFT